MICKICGVNSKKLGLHLKAHKISPKDYYDMYLKKENEGVCPVCCKSTVFLGITYGYRQHCSTSCSTLDPIVKNKNKTTNMLRYGVEHNWNNGILRKNCENTMKERYGVTHNWQSGKLRSKEKLKVSQLEQTLIDYLELYKISYEYRYYDETGKYPYECDFYLPNYDMFIEINGTALHDTHIFNPYSKKDNETLEYCKSRVDSSWYQSKVRIWLKDYEKYQTAIKYNLNYRILWNKSDIDNFIQYLLQNRGLNNDT